MQALLVKLCQLGHLFQKLEFESLALNNPTIFITEKISYLKNKYHLNNIDNDFCAIFYRGNDKVIETQKPSYKEIVDKAIELKQNNNNIIFLIQTDEYNFLQYFINIFPDTIYFTEIPIINNSESNVARQFKNNKYKLDILGFYLASVFIMSTFKNIITTSGNGELFITFFRGNANGIHQYLKKNEYIHGNKNVDYDENETQFWF